MSNIFRPVSCARRRKPVCTVTSMSAMSNIGAFFHARTSSAISSLWSTSTWRNSIPRSRGGGCGRPVIRPALAWFRRRDHFGDPSLPLDVYVRDLAEQKTGRRPQGPIRLLTHLRYFGYCINPISIYYCFTPDGAEIDTLVAEVTNTPWGERIGLRARCGRTNQRQSAGRISKSDARFAIHADGFALRLAFHRAGAASRGAS
jgi:hypothetical protein